MAFDPSALAPFIGGISPGGGSAFLRGWSRAQQELEQRNARTQQGQIQQEQLGFQRSANERANAAESRAQQDQLIQAVTSLRGLLEDPNIEDPALYGQREQFALGMAPRLGVDPGFIQSLRPTPTVFQQRQAKKKLAEIEKAYSAPQLAMLEADDQTGAAPVFEVGGEQLTIAQLRERAGTAAMVGGKPMSMRPPTKAETLSDTAILADVPLDRQHAAAVASGNTALASQIEDAIKRQDLARSQPADPQLAETNRQLAALRLEAAQNAARSGPALPPAVQRRVDMKTRAFDQQPIVKKIQTMAESVQFTEGLNINTTNPADDQALIYAFAKAMDPESVVREGEYATVQKYAQSWAERFGFDVARIFSNTTFLTPQARQNMKTTIRARYQAARPQYENLRRSYVQQINQITGSNDGETHLIDYAAGFPTEPAQTAAPAAGRGPVSYEDYLRSRGQR